MRFRADCILGSRTIWGFSEIRQRKGPGLGPTPGWWLLLGRKGCDPLSGCGMKSREEI